MLTNAIVPALIPVILLLLYICIRSGILIPFPKRDDDVFDRGFARSFLGITFGLGQVPPIYRLGAEELKRKELSLIWWRLIFLLLGCEALLLFNLSYRLWILSVAVLIYVYAGYIVITYYNATLWEIHRIHRLQFIRERILLAMFSLLLGIRYQQDAVLFVLSALNFLWWIVFPIITKKWLNKFTLGGPGTLRKIRRGRYLIYGCTAIFALACLLLLGVSPVLLLLYSLIFAAVNFINNLTTIWRGMLLRWIKKLKREDCEYED